MKKSDFKTFKITKEMVIDAAFDVIKENGLPYFAESSFVLLCKTMCRQDIALDSINDDIVKQWYDNDSIHTMYIAEITGIMIR